MNLTLELESSLLDKVRQITQVQGWPPEDGVLILLGYGAAVHVDIGEGDPVHALGTARAELARLRHRAFTASEAVRDLGMNISGLTASIAQAERSLVTLEQRVIELRKQGGG